MATASIETVPEGQYQGAIRLGIKGEREIYWFVPSNTVIEYDGVYSDETDVHDTESLSDPVGNYILEADRGGGSWKFTRLAEFFRGVASFDGTKILTAREEEVYGISRYSDIPDDRAADMLGISTNTYQEVERRASRKVACAFNLVDAVSH